MKISIITPAYEAKGRGVELMTDLLRSLENQKYKNFEVIVSDHSQNDEIEKLCKDFSNIDIIHFYNERGRGNSSINMNEGIKRATGDVIKVMHMDDIIINKNCLGHIAREFKLNPKAKWGALAFNHNYETGKNPEVRRIIVPSMDTVIGCPSVSFFILDKKSPNLFDENLIIINDHDMHQRLNEKYGPPIILGDEENIYITIRMHSEQVSGWIGEEKEEQEREYLKLKNIMKETDALSEIANKYASDKGTIAPSTGNHGPRLHFTTKYNKYMESMRNDEITILEIGIGSGPSLKMWYDYFPNATIHAIDVDNHTALNNDRVTTHVCDQSDRLQLHKLMDKIGPVDILVDDGSHVIAHQQISLGYLFQHVKKGGQYWIEDLHTSDREVWQGKELYGYDMSIKEGESTVEVLEDYINTKEFKSPFMTKKEIDYLNENIVDMEMFELPKSHWGINKLCFIKK